MTGESKSDITRKRILTEGRDLVLAAGFGGMGLKDLLARAAVPKGSFYHYFPSKEAFGCALLQDYVDDYLARMDALIAAPAPAGARMMRFWSAWLDDAAGGGIAGRCLVVKLAAEIPDLSEDMRRILDDGVAQLTARVARLLRDGAADGSIAPQDDPDAAAANLYALWLGAAVLAKLARDTTPLRRALADTGRRLAP